MDKVPLTTVGYAHLEKEIKHLKTVERPNVIKAIAEARAHGDLSENAEYHAAREKQSFIEGRVKELEDIQARSEVIDVAELKGDSVKFGATVTLEDEDSGETTTYTIVGEYEADLKAGRISINAPIARALIGKKKDDSVEVSTPKGSRFYAIINVQFIPRTP